MRASAAISPGVVHAHFDDRKFVLRLQAEQLQGQPEAVVEIALRI